MCFIRVGLLPPHGSGHGRGEVAAIHVGQSGWREEGKVTVRDVRAGVFRIAQRDRDTERKVQRDHGVFIAPLDHDFCSAQFFSGWQSAERNLPEHGSVCPWADLLADRFCEFFGRMVSGADPDLRGVQVLRQGADVFLEECRSPVSIELLPEQFQAEAICGDLRGVHEDRSGDRGAIWRRGESQRVGVGDPVVVPGFGGPACVDPFSEFPGSFRAVFCFPVLADLLQPVCRPLPVQVWRVHGLRAQGITWKLLPDLLDPVVDMVGGHARESVIGMLRDGPQEHSRGEVVCRRVSVGVGQSPVHVFRDIPEHLLAFFLPALRHAVNRECPDAWKCRRQWNDVARSSGFGVPVNRVCGKPFPVVGL